MLRNINLFLLLIATATVNAGLFFEQHELEDAFEDGGRNCTKPGPMCDDCRTRVFCFQLPNGEWIKDPLDTCPDGQTCMSSTSQCTSGINVECIVDYRFTCYQSGLFPDAYNCSKYHVCVNNDNGTVISKPIDEECRRGFAYDPVTTLCRRKASGCSTDDYPVCRSVGQTGQIGDHPTMYYTCLSVDGGNGTRRLFPQIFYCPDDELYVDGDCLTPKELSGLNDNGVCEGSGDFYIDGDECDEYNVCPSAGSRPMVNRCPKGERFDPVAGTCADIACLV